jgi:hypothetical protein
VTESNGTPALDLGSASHARISSLHCRTDGHFIGYEPLVCQDDAEAIEKTKCLVNGYDVEVWQQARMVAKLVASNPK